jgi:hypothetical protein
MSSPAQVHERKKERKKDETKSGHAFHWTLMSFDTIVLQESSKTLLSSFLFFPSCVCMFFLFSLILAGVGCCWFFVWCVFLFFFLIFFLSISLFFIFYFYFVSFSPCFFCLYIGERGICCRQTERIVRFVSSLSSSFSWLSKSFSLKSDFMGVSFSNSHVPHPLSTIPSQHHFHLHFPSVFISVFFFSFYIEKGREWEKTQQQQQQLPATLFSFFLFCSKFNSCCCFSFFSFVFTITDIYFRPKSGCRILILERHERKTRYGLWAPTGESGVEKKTGRKWYRNIINPKKK